MRDLLHLTCRPLYILTDDVDGRAMDGEPKPSAGSLNALCCGRQVDLGFKNPGKFADKYDTVAY